MNGDAAAMTASAPETFIVRKKSQANFLMTQGIAERE
jgi:hypothetical protein